MAYAIPVVSWVVTTVLGTVGIGGTFLSGNFYFLLALIPLGILIFLVAPFNLWKKASEDLEKITKKRLLVSLSLPDIRENMGIGKQEWFRIKVHNPTALPISGCYGKLVEFRPKLPYPNLPSPGVMFPWTSFGGRGKLTTIASQDSDFLDVLVFNGKRISMVILDDRSGERDLNSYALLVDEYDLVIQIGSQTEGFPPNIVNISVKPYVVDYKEQLSVSIIDHSMTPSTNPQSGLYKGKAPKIRGTENDGDSFG